MEVKNKLDLYILAQGADSAPPLGTVLGNMGVNSINFCKDFNIETADLPNYLTLSVRINVFHNKSYNFAILGLPLTPLLSLVCFEQSNWFKGKLVMRKSIKLKHLVQLAKFAFPNCTLPRALPIIFGTLKSCNLVVVL